MLSVTLSSRKTHMLDNVLQVGWLACDPCLTNPWIWLRRLIDMNGRVPWMQHQMSWKLNDTKTIYQLTVPLTLYSSLSFTSTPNSQLSRSPHEPPLFKSLIVILWRLQYWCKIPSFVACSSTVRAIDSLACDQTKMYHTSDNVLQEQDKLFLCFKHCQWSCIWSHN